MGSTNVSLGNVVNSLTHDECSITGTAGIACGQVTSNATYKAGRLDPGAATHPIDVWNICRYVDNTSTNGTSHPIFWNSAPEWQAICSGTHQDLSLSYCARPEVPVLPPGPNCGTPVLKTAAAALPYARVTSNVAAGVVETAQYTCTNTGNACTSATQWVETVTATYLPSQASPDLPSTHPNWKSGWTLSGSASYDDSQMPHDCGSNACGGEITVYGVNCMAGEVTDNIVTCPPTSRATEGTHTRRVTCPHGLGAADFPPIFDVPASGTCVPDATCQPTVNGQCGSANGVAVASAPTSNLCQVGTASEVSGSGPFTWICTGSNGGVAANCSAPLDTPTAKPQNIVAGCFVDTVALDHFTEGSCDMSENDNKCTGTNTIVFSVGDTFTPWYDAARFSTPSRYTVQWTGVNCTNPTEEWCYVENAKNGRYTANVSVYDKQLGTTQTFTVTAHKSTISSTSFSCNKQPE